MNSPTLETIAAKLGLHKSTVSRALRVDPSVKPETIKRVKEAASECDYRPDPAASALAESRWKVSQRQQAINLGYLCHGVNDTELGKSHAFQYLVPPARNLGFAIIPLALNNKVNPSQLNRRMKQLNIGGVVIGMVNFRKGELDRFDWDGLAWNERAWVAVGEGEYAPKCHQVLSNAMNCTYDALQAMAVRGFRRIAFAYQIHAFSQVFMRQQAGCMLFARHHPEIVISDLGHASPARLSQLLVDFAPDAILYAFSDLRNSLGKSIQALPWATLGARPGESGMRSNLRQRSETAISMLDMLYRHGKFGLPKPHQALLLDSEWIEGGTLQVSTAHG